MPFTYVFDAATDIVRTTAHGLIHRTALVVSTLVDFGMARMYGALAQKVDPDFVVFRDLGEAEAWLRRA
jgi:hypothetical protein